MGYNVHLRKYLYFREKNVGYQVHAWGYYNRVSIQNNKEKSTLQGINDVDKTCQDPN